MIKVENLSKDYKLGDGTDFFALKDVNIEIPQGIFVGVLGPSGSGKSTFMHIVGGMDRPTKGNITIDNIDISTLSTNELSYFRRNKIGFVFQSFYLIESLTVIENVMTPAIFSGLSASVSRKKAKELLEKVNIIDKFDLKVSNLSGGQKQRVAIARALMNNPDIILADEPTGNLDSKNGDEVMSILKDLVKEGKTVIMVTHNKDLVADSPFVISFVDGSIVKVDKKNFKEKEIKDSKFKNKNIKFSELIRRAKDNIFQNKLRNLLTAFGIGIGVAMLIILLSFGFGLKANLEQGLSSIISTNTITVTPSKNSNFSFSPSTTSSSNQKTLDLSTVSSFSKIKNVKADWGESTFLGNLVYKNNKSEIFIESLSPNKYIDSNIVNSVTTGKIPQGSNGGLLIQKAVAQNLGVKNIKTLIGSYVNLAVGPTGGSLKSRSTSATPTSLYTNPETFKIKIVGITSGDLSYISYNQSIVWSKLLENVKNPKFSYITVLSNNTNNVSSIANSISNKGYGTQTLESVISELNTPFLIVDSILGIIGGISLVVSAIMILVIMLMEILERTREIGILKAIGAKRSDVRNLFVFETVVIGAIGGIFGLVIGIIVISILNYVIDIFIKASGGSSITLFSSPLYFYFAVFLFGIVISVLAGLYPSSKASKMNPIDALRYE